MTSTWRALWLCSLLVVLCGGCVAPAARAPTLFAGVASVDLTPDWPVAMGGYGARMGQPSEGVHDHVFAKALYLEAGGGRIVLVTTDLLGSLLTLRTDVSKQLPPDLRVIFAASHTHSAPGALVDTRDILLVATVGKFDRKLYDAYRDRLVDVIRRAMQARAPATFAIASVDAPEFCRNRRSKHYPQGQAPVDPALAVAKIGNALVVNYTAHATILGAENMLLSADWPGALQRHLESTGIAALYTNGAEGDISPASPGGSDDFDKCERMGAALAQRVLAISMPPAADPVDIDYLERELDLPPPSPLKWVTKSVLGVLRINDAAFVCVPGELTAELGLELKRRYRDMGWRHVWIVGLANDHLFYVLSEEQHAKGGYERSMSFYGPTFGSWMVERFTELGRELLTKRH